MDVVPALMLFMALILDLAMYGLTVSGHFPAEFRATSLSTGFGPAILWGTLLIAMALAIVAVGFAWRAITPAFAIIGGGAMLLAAPLLLQPLPDRFVNHRAALLVFAALGLGIASLALRLTF